MSDTEILDPKEKLLLEFMITDKALFAKVITIMDREYFCEGLGRVVEFIQKYFNKRKDVPSAAVIKAETGVVFEVRTLEKHEYDYVVDEMERHCQREAMRLAVLKGAQMVNDAMDNDESYDFGAVQNAVRDALMLSVDKDLGISQLEDNVHMRHALMQEKIDSRNIGWTELDKLIGQVRRGEMVLFAGTSGSGKSVTLANVAKKMAEQGLRTLLLSFELKQELVSMRMDSIITGYSVKSVYDHTDAISDKFAEIKSEYGAIHIKKMRYRDTANTIRAYLLEYNLTFGCYPDVIIIDHMDRMGPIEKKPGSGKFDVDEDISEELRDIFDEFDAYGFTASQLNRDSVDAVHKSQAHIAGGISKINTSDAAIAIVRTSEQIANGEIEFQAMKLRNAEMKLGNAILYWNDNNLQITDTPSAARPASAKPKSKEVAENPRTIDKVKDLLAKSKRN